MASTTRTPHPQEEQCRTGIRSSSSTRTISAAAVPDRAARRIWRGVHDGPGQIIKRITISTSRHTARFPSREIRLQATTRPLSNCDATSPTRVRSEEAATSSPVPHQLIEGMMISCYAAQTHASPTFTFRASFLRRQDSRAKLSLRQGNTGTSKMF